MMTGHTPRLADHIDRTPDSVDEPGAITAPDRADYRAMLFDRDGYALTHNRNLFAASMWLSEMIESEAQWPVIGNELRDYLSGAGHTPDHIDQQIATLESLFTPWLNRVRRTDDTQFV